MTSTTTALVCGMHRSGTSMVGSILYELGVPMGDDLMPAAPDNPLGFYEDLDFVNLHNEILEAAGGDWDMNPPARYGILRAASSYMARIRQLIRDRNERYDVWGFKDPRASLLMDVYLHELRSPHLIVCLRSRVDVASSLVQRGDTDDLYLALAVVDEYTSRLDYFLGVNPGLPTLLVEYDDARSHPQGVVEEIQQFLSLNVDDETTARAVARIVPANMPNPVDV